MKKIFIIIIILVVVGGFGFISLRNYVYPLKYSEYVEKYASEYGVDKYLVYAVIKGESNFDPNAVSNKGAIGLMQLLQNTADDIGAKMEMGDVNLYDEETNIRIGTKHLSSLIEKYSGNINLAIIAYNAGTGNVTRWIVDGIIKEDGSDLENVPYKETNMYIRKILWNYKIYRILYGNE